MSKGNILIVWTNYRKAYPVMESLKKAGYKVFAGIDSRDTSLLSQKNFSRYIDGRVRIINPNISENEYVKSVIEATRKLNHVNPILDAQDIGYEQAVTPAVFKAKGFYYMAFAGKPKNGGRRICIAHSEDLKGPWRFLMELILPQYFWEGNDIDLGPSVVKQTEDEVLIYYRYNKWGLRKVLLGPRYWVRMIGVLKLRLRSPTIIEAYRYERNPLKHLNGSKGAWNESLFCPSCIQLGKRYYLLPAASTYSVGFPYKQYIGLIEDHSPFFKIQLIRRYS